MRVLDVPARFRPSSSLYPSDGAGAGGWFEKYVHESGVIDVPDMTYVPIYWTAMSSRHFLKIQQWLWPQLDPKKQYVTVINAGGHHLINKPENLLVVGPTAGDDIVIPYGSDRLLRRRHLNRRKTDTINFIGTINAYTDYKGVRTRSLKQLPQGSVTKVNKGDSNKVPLTFEDYLDTISRCKYTLAPRGYNVSSYRLFESLAVGSIPVYVWKDASALPFSNRDDVDWDSFTVVTEDPWDGTLPERSVEAGRAFYNRYCRPEELVHRIQEELIK